MKIKVIDFFLLSLVLAQAIIKMQRMTNQPSRDFRFVCNDVPYTF